MNKRKQIYNNVIQPRRKFKRNQICINQIKIPILEQMIVRNYSVKPSGPQLELDNAEIGELFISKLYNGESRNMPANFPLVYNKNPYNSFSKYNRKCYSILSRNISNRSAINTGYNQTDELNKFNDTQILRYKQNHRRLLAITKNSRMSKTDNINLNEVRILSKNR